MATRRDQLQSYQFLLQRVVSALVYRKTDPAQSPFRKAGGAVFAGVMISVLALAVTAAIQLLITGFGGKDTTWWEGGVIVLEKETGAQYVVFPSKEHQADLADKGVKVEQMLYPVRNFTSAALLAGTTEFINVDQNSLTGEGVDGEVPARGMLVGIPDLPDSLPSTEALLDPGWAVCSDPNKKAFGSQDASSVLFVGAQPAKGDKLKTAQSRADRDEVLILQEENSQTTYLVTDSQKHKIVEPDKVRPALGLTSEPEVVAPGFIKAIPTGVDLAIPDVPRLGEESQIGSDVTVGDVYRSDVGDNVSYHVALVDGAAEISELQAELLTSETGQAEYKTGSEALNAATNDSKYQYRYLPDKDDSTEVAQALPFAVPSVANGWDTGQASCVAFPDAGSPAHIVINANIPERQGINTQQVSTDANTYADRIVVPPGRGMLVRTGENAGAIGLITSDGRMYPFSAPPNPDTGPALAVGGTGGLEALGYEKESPVSIPPEILELIPRGVPLDPAAAAASVPAFQNGNEDEDEE